MTTSLHPLLLFPHQTLQFFHFPLSLVWGHPLGSPHQVHTYHLPGLRKHMAWKALWCGIVMSWTAILRRLLSAMHPHEDTTGKVSLQQPQTSQSLLSLGQLLSSYPLSSSHPQSAGSRDSAPPPSLLSHAWSVLSQGQSVLASAEPSSLGGPMSPMMPPLPHHLLAGSEYWRHWAGMAPSLSTSLHDQTCPLPPIYASHTPLLSSSFTHFHEILCTSC